MTCRCKESITVASFINFLANKYYGYHIDIHEETGRKIYYIKYSNQGEKLPMVEEKFYKYFDNIQKIREEKLNKILND